MNSSFKFLSFSEIDVLTEFTFVVNSSSDKFRTLVRILARKMSSLLRMWRQSLVGDWIRNQQLMMSLVERGREKTTYPSCSFVRS